VGAAGLEPATSPVCFSLLLCQARQNMDSLSAHPPGSVILVMMADAPALWAVPCHTLPWVELVKPVLPLSPCHIRGPRGTKRTRKSFTATLLASPEVRTWTWVMSTETHSYQLPLLPANRERGLPEVTSNLSFWPPSPPLPPPLPHADPSKPRSFPQCGTASALSVDWLSTPYLQS
jgi:hypothetical protein